MQMDSRYLHPELLLATMEQISNITGTENQQEGSPWNTLP